MPPPPAADPDCLAGRHRPRRVRAAADGQPARTTCRDCGCALVRTAASRRWFYSGTLGAA